MKRILLKIIKIYQKTLSIDHGPVSLIVSERFCRFYPSCSEYSYQAIEKYGAGKGTWLGFKRVIRCHPWNDGGYDPIP